MLLWFPLKRGYSKKMTAEEGWGDIAEAASYLQVTKDSIYR